MFSNEVLNQLRGVAIRVRASDANSGARDATPLVPAKYYDAAVTRVESAVEVLAAAARVASARDGYFKWPQTAVQTLRNAEGG
jgi:hypothetical protein